MSLGEAGPYKEARNVDVVAQACHTSTEKAEAGKLEASRSYIES